MSLDLLSDFNWMEQKCKVMSSEKELLRKSTSEVTSSTVVERPRRSENISSGWGQSVGLQSVCWQRRLLESSHLDAGERGPSFEAIKKWVCAFDVDDLRQTLMQSLWFKIALKSCQCHFLPFLLKVGTTLQSAPKG